MPTLLTMRTGSQAKSGDSLAVPRLVPLMQRAGTILPYFHVRDRNYHSCPLMQRVGTLLPYLHVQDRKLYHNKHLPKDRVGLLSNNMVLLAPTHK